MQRSGFEICPELSPVQGLPWAAGGPSGSERWTRQLRATEEVENAHPEQRFVCLSQGHWDGFSSGLWNNHESIPRRKLWLLDRRMRQKQNRKTQWPKACKGRWFANTYVMVFLTDQNLGIGVNEKKVKKRRMWGTQVSSGTRVLYSWQCVLIYCNTRSFRQKIKWKTP